jgi:hypothetical protein
MPIYEVNLSVDREIADEFGEWLPGHVAGMLRLGGFESASWFERVRLEGEPVDEERVHWTLHYRVRDRAALDAYFADHAAGMRQQGLHRFGGRFAAERRILRERERFDASG